MNDKLRFRVWDKEFSEYWTDEQIKENASWLLFPNNANIDCIKIERCTGVEDKNGKLIYEGDIVQSKFNGLGRIVYHHSAFVVVWKNKVSIHGCKITSIPLDTENIEVIHNIHNNLELLEK